MSQQLDMGVLHSILEKVAIPSSYECLAQTPITSSLLGDIAHLPFPRLPDSLLLISPLALLRVLSSSGGFFCGSLDDLTFRRRVQKALDQHPGLTNAVILDSPALYSFSFLSSGFKFIGVAPCAAALLRTCPSVHPLDLSLASFRLLVIAAEDRPPSPSMASRLLQGLRSLLSFRSSNGPICPQLTPAPLIPRDRLRKLALAADLLVIARPDWDSRIETLIDIATSVRATHRLVLQQPVLMREIGDFEAAVLCHPNFTALREIVLSTGKPGGDERVLDGLRLQAATLESLSVYLGPMAEGEPSSVTVDSLLFELPALRNLRLSVTLDTIDEVVVSVPPWIRRIAVSLPFTSFHMPQFNLHLLLLSEVEDLASVTLEGFSTTHLRAFLRQLVDEDSVTDLDEKCVEQLSFRIGAWSVRGTRPSASVLSRLGEVRALGVDEPPPTWTCSRARAGRELMQADREAVAVVA